MIQPDQNFKENINKHKNILKSFSNNSKNCQVFLLKPAVSIKKSQSSGFNCISMFIHSSESSRQIKKTESMHGSYKNSNLVV